VLRIRDVYPGSNHFLVCRIRPSFIPDPDPTNKRREKLTYLFHAGIGIIEVIFQTKLNFSCFSKFLKVKS
jgi:hypothetical protein